MEEDTDRGPSNIPLHNPRHNSTLDTRLSRLEAIVENFVSTVSNDIQQQNRSIDALRKAFQEHNRTPWTNVFGGATIVLLIIGMFGSGYVRDLSRVELLQAKLLDTFTMHVSDGHPRRVEERMNAYKEYDDARMAKLQSKITRMEEEGVAAHKHTERLRALERDVFGYGHKVNGLD